MARELKAKVKIEADTKKARTELGKLDKTIDQTGKSTSRLGGIFSKFNVGLIASTLAIAGLVSGLRRGLEGAKQQEDAVNALNSALQGLGDSAGAVSAQLQRQADTIQSTTKFSNESVIEAQAVIAAFTDEASTIEKLTLATTDLAEAKGISLVQAADLLAKSFGSSTNALSRYGVEVEGAAGSQERLLQLTEGVADLYGGRATDAIETFSGATAQLTNNIDDLLKAIVEFGTKSDTIVSIIGGISKATERVTRGLNRMKVASEQSGGVFAFVADKVLGPYLSKLIGVEGAAERVAIAQAGLAATTKDVADEAKDAADRVAELAAAELAAAEAAKAASIEHERYIKSLEKLGFIIVDTDQLLVDNEQSIKDVTRAFDAGLITQDQYLDKLEELNTATLDLIESNRGFASNIRAEEIPALAEATLAVTQQTLAIDRSTEAKTRNVQATREQIAVEQQQRGAGDSFTDIEGGVFEFSPGVTIQQVNGRVGSVFGVQGTF